MKKVHQEARIENVYQLEGRVPVGKAIPSGCSMCWPCLWRTSHR